MSRGGPHFFRCWRCKREHRGPSWNCGGPDGISFTWRSRTYYSKRRHRLSARGEPIQVQYSCNCCGWIGWTNHVSVVQRYAREL